jgi:hypothetical protein
MFNRETEKQRGPEVSEARWRAFGCLELSFRKSRSGEGKGGGGQSRRSNFALIWSKVLQELLGAWTPGSPSNLEFRSRYLFPKMRKQTPGGFPGKLLKF